jgi:hypothetical protein
MATVRNFVVLVSKGKIGYCLKVLPWDKLHSKANGN